MMVVPIKTRQGLPSGWETRHPLDAPIFALTPPPKKKNYMWQVIGDMWHMTQDTQGVMSTVSKLQDPSCNSFVVMMSSDMWYVICDMWHMKCDISNVGQVILWLNLGGIFAKV